MPQADTAAAPAPVTPRTFRKRRRSTELLMSVVAHAAVAGHVVLDVAAHAPPHAQGRNLGYLRHLLDVPVTCHGDVQKMAQVSQVSTLRMGRSEEHTSELQSQSNLVCRLLLEQKK